MEIMGQLQGLMGAMQKAVEPPPPVQMPPPPPPMSPATRAVMSQPGTPPLEALMSELLRQRQQKAG